MKPLDELTPYEEELPKNIIHKWMFESYAREILREPIPYYGGRTISQRKLLKESNKEVKRKKDKW